MKFTNLPMLCDALRVGDSSRSEEASPTTECYVDTDFGLDQSYVDILPPQGEGRVRNSSTVQNRPPLQVSIFMSPKWLSVNVGVDGADIMVQNLVIVWLIIDFSALFFTDPAYGNPTLRREDEVAPQRGLDVRVWATNPHIQLLSIAEAGSGCRTEAIMVETQDGVFYQYQMDDEQVTRTKSQ